MDDERRRHLDLFLSAAREIPPQQAYAHGRGIVTCGSLKFTAYLWILIRSLRHHGCTLPIELWHMEGEINEPLRRFLEPHGVTFRDAGHLQWAMGQFLNARHGIKPYAILHSSFREIIFLDADNCVFRDPTFLFDTDAFVRHRAIFWPDWSATAGRLGAADLRRDFGLDAGGEEFETGQIVVDRVDCWRALTLTLHLAQHADYYFRFLYGDKEAFHLAFDFVQQSYLLVPHPVLSWRGDWERKGFIQHWIDGQPLFHHRVGRKWEAIVTREESHDLPALPAAVVREILVELRRRWSSVVPIRERLRFHAGIARRVSRDRRPAWLERILDSWLGYYLRLLGSPTRLRASLEARVARVRRGRRAPRD